MDAEMSSAVIECIRENKEIKTIVEIGSSLAPLILELMNEIYSIFFWSIECNKAKYDTIRDLPYDDRTTLLWGSIVEKDHVQSQKYLSLFPPLYTSVDLFNSLAAPQVLDQLPEKIDFLLLDGGNITALHEFSLLFSRCVGYIALKNTKLDSCKEIRARLTVLFEWSESVSIDTRNGFSIFKRISL